MTDLVKRLRIGIHTSADEQVLRDEAADRIEHLENRCANLLVGNGALNIRSDKLEAALQEIAAGYETPWSTSTVGNMLDVAEILSERIGIARKALDDAP
jgi:hypothetical protein